MPARRLEDEIDRLYQLPLDEFTAARNRLAKEKGAAGVRELAKPPVAAWAINQVYWNDRAPYSALIRASEDMRRTHKSVLAGKGGDLRAAGKSHDEALDAALKAALAQLEASGHPVTDATRQAIVTTLRALPSDEAPGRLARTLQPGGFEMLAGFSIAGAGRALTARPPGTAPAAERTAEKKNKPAPKGAKETPAEKGARARAQAKAREAAAAATRELRQAEQAAQRAEFDAARAVREAEKAEREAVEARKTFEAAREALEEAEAAVPPAVRAREAAARRAEQAEEKVAAARSRLEDAQSKA